MDRLNNLPPDKLGEIFERMRPELIGVELEDSQDVLDSMFDRTGEKLLDDEDFLKKLENPCLFSTNSSRSPSLKSYRSRSTEPLRSPRARSSSPEVRRSTSPNIVFSPSPRPQITPYPRLISPESAISISPGSSRLSEPVLPVPRVSFSYDYGFGKDYTEDEIAVLTYIDQYKPVEEVIEPELHPFVIEYMAAFGDVDSFIKVPRPDEIDDNVGLTSLDEPPSDQSDAAIVDMQIRHATKDAAYLDDEVPVKILEKADEKPDEIKKWIADIKTLHKSQPATTVHYKTKLPDIETLMQEWTPKMEEIMRTIRLPTADLDVSLEKYVDICLNILDIPVGNSRIEALHVMFSLLNEFCNSQHFRNLAQNNSRVDDSRERMDRLEL